MENLLTSKQVQDIFKVDRITVYRMLQDGRLRGVKIGNQWRFPQREVEKLLSGEIVEVPVSNESESIFPIHCVQTIQDLFSSVSNFSALIIDSNGKLVTRISRPNAISTLLQSTPAGNDYYQASWQEIAAKATGREEMFTCHAGLRYFGSVIINQNKKQGVFLVGEFYLASDDQEKEKKKWNEIAKICAIDEQELIQAYQQIPRLLPHEQAHLTSQPAAAAFAVESILTERGAFMNRLQQIANLTQKL